MSPDAVVGREALIRAACELLEQLPPAKVTRAEVARHAGVDPALIRYYFKDRASLLQAVVQQITDSFYETIAAPGASIEERIRSVAANSFAFMTAYPFLHRLAVEELAGSPSVEARGLFHDLTSKGVGVWKAILDDGVASGELKDVNPVLPYLALLGLCESFASSRIILEDLVGPPAEIEALTPTYAALVTDMVLRGLRV